MKKRLIKHYKRVMAFLCVVALVVTTFGSSFTNVFAADNVKIEINGFQISTTIEGFRTLYSVSDPQGEVTGCGLVYGLADYASESDMIVNSSNNTVYDYAATDAGKTSVSYSKLSDATSYAMTMKLIKMADFYNAKVKVRAYAKLADGSIIYSDISTTTIYAIAEFLYNNGRMGTEEAHTYLYDNILSVVNPNQQVIDYQWTSSVVKPQMPTEAPVTQAPTTVAPTEAPTEAPTTTTQANVDNGIPVPFGLEVSCPSDNVIAVVWGRGDIDNYNVYINDVLVAANVPCARYEYFGYAAGTYRVSVTTSKDGEESASAGADVVVTGSSSVEPGTTTVQQPATSTQPSTTNANTDTSIPVPFGMVVSNPSDNTVGVVWGAGDINSYNLYIDDELVVQGVVAAYYEFYGYLKGTHTVSIATSSNGKESERITLSVDVNGVSNVDELTTKRQIDYDNSDETYSDPIPQLPDIPAREDRMYFKMNNSTGGEYSDNQIYWCIVGKNTSGQLCYVDKEGNLIPASAALNTIRKGDRWCADICYSLAEADYLYMPSTIDSGRMYISYGEQVYLTFNTDDLGNTGYAGPDLNNATDPNQDVLFEFIEFTITNKEYWGNTTRVDFYSFPVVTRLFGDGGWNNYPGDANHYDRTVGDLGTRDEIFAAYKNEVPNKFKTLVTDKRIMAPCKLTFNEGQVYANYYDAYINEFWAKYTNEDLVFTCDAGTFRGRVEGDRMRFTKDGDSGTYYVYKPTTQDVLEGKGNFNRGNSTELVIEAQLCAAMIRGVAMEPENFDNEDAFYQHSNSNFYSGFWHDHSYDGLAYGFCYDDVFDYSTLLHYTNPTGLVIDLRW